MVGNDRSTGIRGAEWMAAVLLVLALPMAAIAHPPDDDHVHHDQVHSGTTHGSLSQVSHKLSNPLLSVWALFTEFDLNFNNGNANQGDDKIGNMPVKFEQ